MKVDLNQLSWLKLTPKNDNEYEEIHIFKTYIRCSFKGNIICVSCELVSLSEVNGKKKIKIQNLKAQFLIKRQCNKYNVLYYPSF